MVRNITLFLGLSIIATAIYLDSKLLKVSKYKITCKKLPKEFNQFKIVQLSDFHQYKYFSQNSSVIINKINQEEPDIIVMTGDMVNKYDKNFDYFLKLAERLSERYKVYYIVGNHEKRLKESHLNFIIQKLVQFGIKVVNDKKIILRKDKDYINIYGIDIPLLYYKTKNRPSNIDEIVSAKLNKCNNKEYNILLAHNPLYFDTYSKYNIDLTLSGHVHGGMIRLPFIGGLLSPERKFFPKYSSGIYNVNSKQLIVSRGMGHSKPGLRVFNRPEIVSITLFH